MIREHETLPGEPTMEPMGSEFRTAERIEAERIGMAGRADGRSLTELFKSLRDETTLLVRQEVDLAKTEMSEKAAKAGRNAGYIGAGSVLAHAGAIVLLLGLSALLYYGLVEWGMSHMIAGWLAPLIVGAVIGLIGYVLIQKGVSTLKHESFVPKKTVDSLKENQQWLSRKATA
ncbi:MAG: phage holin family protein [Planctomycetaceae bacterium]